jgi:hypothetical protein
MADFEYTSQSSTTPAKSAPLDFSHHFSRVTKARKESSIKEFYKYFTIPGIGNLAGGKTEFDSMIGGVLLTIYCKNVPLVGDKADSGNKVFQMHYYFLTIHSRPKLPSRNDSSPHRTTPTTSQAAPRSLQLPQSINPAPILSHMLWSLAFLRFLTLSERLI